MRNTLFRSKSPWALLLILAWLCVHPLGAQILQQSLAHTTDLLSNPGYEGGLAPFSSGVQNGTLTVERNPAHVLSGLASLRHAATAANSYTSPWYGSNAVSYSGETSFRLSVWAKASSAAQTRVFLFCLDDQLQTSPEYYVFTTDSVSTEWQQLVLDHTCPASHSYVSYRLDNHTAGQTVWWDDPRLIALDEKIACGTFEEPGFQEPFELVSNGTLEQDPTVRRKGQTSLRHTATGADSYTSPWRGTLASSLSKVNGETPYLLSVWAKAAAPTPIQLRIFCLDSKYNTTFGSSVASYTTGTTWQEYTLEHRCPAGAEHVSLRLDNDGGPGSVVWWDDARLEEMHNRSDFLYLEAPAAMATGETQTVRMVFRNSGTTEWRRDSSHRLGNLDGGIWGPGRVQLLPDETVAPTSLNDLTFQITAPSLPGEYPFQWRMLEEGVEWFGASSPAITIQVYDAASGGSTPWPPSGPPANALQRNGRNFVTPSGNPVYLAGSHTWDNLQDWGDFPDFKWQEYLDMMQAKNHNLMRLWTWENWNNGRPDRTNMDVNPLPWSREKDFGSSCTKRFDLYMGDLDFNNPEFFDESRVKFDPAYFDRLAQRVSQAGGRGIYVDVMLFQGFSIRAGNAESSWRFHPLNSDNNCEGLDGNLSDSNTGDGLRHHTINLNLTTVPDAQLSSEQKMEKLVALFQKAYVKKVAATLWSHNNVLFEIANEDRPSATNWQYQMISYLKTTLGMPHPVGMTSFGFGNPNSVLLNSGAVWISPAVDLNNGEDYAFDPPIPSGTVILSDNDHLKGVLDTRTTQERPAPAAEEAHRYRHWIWKNFTRGIHTMLMDAIDNPVASATPINWAVNPSNPDFPYARNYLGHVRYLAEQLDLTAVQPNPSVCSTRFCLADPGDTYVVYQPYEEGQRSFTVTLTPGVYEATWFNPRLPSSGKLTPVNPAILQLTYDGGTVNVSSTSVVTFGGGTRPTPFGCTGSGNFPYQCDAVLLLEKVGAPLPAPTGVSASDATSSHRVKITWNDVPGATTYKVYRDTDSNPQGATVFDTAGDQPIVGSPFTDWTATPNQTYYYWVQAVGTSGTSPLSNSDTGSATDGVIAPVDVGASDGEYTDLVAVLWKLAPGVSSYRIHRDTDANPAGATIFDTFEGEPITGILYVDSTAVPGQVYHYWVEAVGIDGTTDLSESDTGFAGAVQ